MKVLEVAPDAGLFALLAGAQFGDAFSVHRDGAEIDARTAAMRIFSTPPSWVRALLRLRHLLVMPFGLKTSGDGAPAAHGMIGLFPVISESERRLVMGFDDSHLDFRVVLDVAPDGTGQEIVSTTLVRTHNLFGRIYLAVIMPFHRLVVRAMLRQALLQASS